MNKKIVDLLRLQVMEEYQSVLTFTHLAAKIELLGFAGYAKWMQHAVEEEFKHVNKVITYLLDRDQDPQIKQSLPHPICEAKLDNIKDIAEWYFKYQKTVSGQYSNLYDQALQEKDFQTVTLARFFVEDQIEEEKLAQDILDIINNAKDPIIADMRIESLL